MNQPVSSQPPKKSGGALKWILLGCGGILLLGAAFVGVMGYLAYRSFSTDAAKVETSAQEILGFEKPAGYKGIFSMSMMGVKMATLGSGAPGQPNNSTIVLVTMPGTNQEQMRAQMRANMEKQGQSQEIVEKKKNETFKVRGKEVDATVDVTIPKGADARQLTYTFALDNATGHTVLLVLSGPENQADHAWVQKFLDTVK